MSEDKETTQEDKQEEPYAMQEVFAFVTRDPHGNEGVVAILNPTGQMQPLLSFESSAVEGMKDVAQQIATETKQDIKLLKFSGREEVETIEAKIVQTPVG